MTLDINDRPEKLVALAAIRFGPVHSGIRVLDEYRGVQAVLRIDRHANACDDVKLVWVKKRAWPNVTTSP
jgi:hypothetical protein